MPVSVKMSSKNQIVVPRVAREALGLEPGDRLVVTVSGGRIAMEKQPAGLADALEGALSDLGRDGGGLWPELNDG